MIFCWCHAITKCTSIPPMLEKNKKRTLKSQHLSVLQKTADFPLRQETPLVIGDGDDIVLFRPWIA